MYSLPGGPRAGRRGRRGPRTGSGWPRPANTAGAGSSEMRCPARVRSALSFSSEFRLFGFDVLSPPSIPSPRMPPPEATEHRQRTPQETYLTNIPPNPNPPVINPVSIRRRHPRRRHHPHPRHTLQPPRHAHHRRQHIRRHKRRVHPNTAVQRVHVKGRAIVGRRHGAGPRRLVLCGLVDERVALAPRVQHHGVLLVGRLRVLLALAVGEVLREEGLLGGGVVVGAADVGVADGRVAEAVPLHCCRVAGCEVVVEGLLSVEGFVVVRGLGGGVGGGGCGETAGGGDGDGGGVTGRGNTKVSVVRGGKGTRARVDARGGTDFSAERRTAETEISKGGGGLGPRKPGREGTRRGKGGAGGGHLVSGWGAGLGLQCELEDGEPWMVE